MGRSVSNGKVSSKIEWKEVTSAVTFVRKKVNDIVITDNILFEEIQRVILYINENKNLKNGVMKKYNFSKDG